MFIYIPWSYLGRGRGRNNAAIPLDRFLAGEVDNHGQLRPQQPRNGGNMGLQGPDPVFASQPDPAYGRQSDEFPKMPSPTSGNYLASIMWNCKKYI